MSHPMEGRGVRTVPVHQYTLHVRPEGTGWRALILLDRRHIAFTCIGTWDTVMLGAYDWMSCQSECFEATIKLVSKVKE